MDTLGSAWEEFKSTNDRRLTEIERKGSADPLTESKLANLGSVMDRLSTLEVAVSRPGKSASAGYSVPDGLALEHKEAFCAYLRKGAESNLHILEKKALSAGSDPDGGYLVTPQVSERVVRTVYETSPLRRVAAVETISSDSLEILEDRDEAASGWTSETGAVSDTDSPELGKKIIPVHELYAQPKATQKLIDDASVDIELWLAEKLADAFSRKENTSFISGDGIGKPRGILTYDAGTSWGQIEQVVSGDNGNVTADSLIQLYYSLKEEYAIHATFLMNRATAQQARLLKESATGQYLWQPGLTAGAPDTLLGLPVIQAADMPTPATDSLSVAVADFSRAYQIVDRTGIRVLRDPFTDKPFVKFYSTKRVGGDVVNFEAIKLLKLSAS
ncbi:MAG: phage major capsid protein [Hyphomicrobiales bacterium]|nr:phage major capsid protein [Hyphomicrobiales bacterium]